MTLLDIISAAATATTTTTTSTHPLTFNPDLILPFITADPPNPTSRFHLVEPVNGFRTSNSISALTECNSAFSDNLTRRLTAKPPNSLSSAELADMLLLFLQEIGFRAAIPVDATKDSSYKLSSKLHWSFVSRHVLRLVIDACVSLGGWEVLETLIVNDVVVAALRSELLGKLISKSQSELVCLFIKRFSGDLNWSDLLKVLKYFLSPSKEARVNMVSVRKEWEDEALSAAETALEKKIVGEEKLAERKRVVAKEAAVLLMVAYDGFTGPELCLHYLLSAIKVDDMVFSGAVSKLSVEEVLGLIKYLGKWLRRYERFPQAVPCPEAGSVLGLDACQWVPTVEAVAEVFGVVVDEWFSSLLLHSEFHQEMKSVEGVLSSLVVEGRLCGSVASLIEIEISKSEAKAS